MMWLGIVVLWFLIGNAVCDLALDPSKKSFWALLLWPLSILLIIAVVFGMVFSKRFRDKVFDNPRKKTNSYADYANLTRHEQWLKDTEVKE